MALAVLILVISLLLPSTLSQCTTAKALPYFKRSVYEFQVDLVTRIAQQNENHFISSALSPWTLLSAISLGAAEETLEEIEKVLRMHPHKCFNKKFFELVQELTASNDGVTLERTSTVFADNRMQLKDAFVSRIRNTKVCDIQVLGFDNYDEVANTINGYVNRATHGAIEDIVEPNDLEGVYIIMVDALYFKGSWQSKFGAEDTEISAFYDESGQVQKGDVNLMFAEIRTNYADIQQIDATVLELPYGQSERFSMIFFLPKYDVTISSVLTKMKMISLSTIFKLFEQTGKVKVSVEIPRFKMNSDINNMKELLIDMGLKDMFDNSLAKFPDISDYNLYISDFIQKASIEVTEEGTEASAVSAAFFEGRSIQVEGPRFTANRPFMFMIVDKSLEIALFTGAYSKPSVYY